MKTFTYDQAVNLLQSGVIKRFRYESKGLSNSFGLVNGRVSRFYDPSCGHSLSWADIEYGGTPTTLSDRLYIEMKLNPEGDFHDACLSKLQEIIRRGANIPDVCTERAVIIP